MSGLIVTVTERILVSTIIILGPKFWGYCYSNEEEVVKYVAAMFVLLAGSHILEGIQSVFSGLFSSFSLKKKFVFISLEGGRVVL